MSEQYVNVYRIEKGGRGPFQYYSSQHDCPRIVQVMKGAQLPFIPARVILILVKDALCDIRLISTKMTNRSRAGIRKYIIKEK